MSRFKTLPTPLFIEAVIRGIVVNFLILVTFWLLYPPGIFIVCTFTGALHAGEFTDLILSGIFPMFAAPVGYYLVSLQSREPWPNAISYCRAKVFFCSALVVWPVIALRLSMYAPKISACYFGFWPPAFYPHPYDDGMLYYFVGMAAALFVVSKRTSSDRLKSLS